MLIILNGVHLKIIVIIGKRNDKISNRVISKETREKLRLVHLGKPKSEEHKRKISESKKKNKKRELY